MFWKVGRGHCIFCRTRMSVWWLSIAKQIIRGVGKMRVWNLLTIGKQIDQWHIFWLLMKKNGMRDRNENKVQSECEDEENKIDKSKNNGINAMWISICLSSTWDNKVLKGFCFRSLLEAGGVDRLMNVTRQRAKYTSRFFKWCRWWWWGSYLMF